MNNKLRAENSAEPLDTLLMADGNVSSLFPKDLDSMFNLDGNTPHPSSLSLSMQR